MVIMVKCELCPSVLVEGKMCLTCGRSYCLQQNLTTCPFKCRGKLAHFRVREEKLGDVSVEWLLLNGLKVGLVDFEETPSSLPAVLNSLSEGISEKYSLLVFPNRKSACKIINYLRRKSALEEIEYDESFDKSKYTLMEDFETKREYILLNLEATITSQMKFLMTFLSSAFSKINLYREAKNNEMSDALCMSIFNYEKKLGLPFVLVDEELEERIKHSSNNLAGVYGEYEAIVEMMGLFPQETSDFLWQKIKQLYNKSNIDSLTRLDSLLDFVGTQIQIASLVAASMEDDYLKTWVDERFRKMNDEFQSRTSSFPDLSLCANIIIKGLSDKRSYESFEAYAKNVAMVISKSFEVLIPKTLRVAEIDKLYEISLKYESMIEMGLPPVAPKLGTFDEFNIFLLQLFERKTLLPEFRIIIGQILQGNLCFKIWHQNDYVSYLHGLNVTRTVVQLIIDNLPEIKRRFGKEDTHSTLGYHDACLALLMYAQFASTVNDEVTERLLIEESERIANKYDTPSVKIIHDWREFTKLQDYNKLLELLNSYARIDLIEHSYLEPEVKTIMLLAKAVFKKKDFKKDLELAENEALNIAGPSTPKKIASSYFEKSIQNSLIFCHMIHIFDNILTACQDEELNAEFALRTAFLNAEAMRVYLSAKDPLCNFVYKTEVVWFLFIEDNPRILQACAKLIKSNHDVPMNTHFCERVKEWLTESPKVKTRRFLIVDDSQTNESDPWERMLTKIISERKRKDFEKSISSSQAFVFVEGPIDVAVLEEFTKKLLPRKQILFMPVEGFSTMSNYYQTNIVKKIEVPIYMLLDGDVMNDPKKKKVFDKLIQKIDLPKESIFNLSQNSIENYLLFPYAIKKAFSQNLLSEEEIADFMKKNSNKRDKKQVLINLSGKMQTGSYGPEKAGAIATKINVTDISPDIGNILAKMIMGGNEEGVTNE